MFIDGRGVSAGTVVETDIAIIGAGAAGITLARALIGTGRKIALIESGGFDPDDDTQDLYYGESGGVQYPLVGSRLRYFGGTTNHWGGWCRPLRPIDFEGRAALGIPAWPFHRSTLEPYYAGARTVCQLGAGDFDAPEAWENVTGWKAIPLAGRDIETRFFLFSPPTRFGQVYRDEIGKAAEITSYLNSNVLEIVPDKDLRRVDHLQIATLSGARFTIRPRLCILAAGGIENARLLLNSNSVQAAGLGNGHDLVGRYFMEHVTVPADVARLAIADRSLVPSYYVHSPTINQTNLRAIFMTSDHALRRDQRLGISLSIYESHEPGARQDDLTPTEGTLETGLVDLLGSLQPARASGMIYGVACALEPQPDAGNRVTLSEQRDALGQRRVKLTWRPTGREHVDMARNLAALARGIGGWGGSARLLVSDLEAWPEPEIGWGNHHMGTTRMSTDPRAGVVDADCRVHGFANFYIAGSSVFPSCGPVNPTLTIVALALRLADHVRMVKL
jgi:choline dehydrogenase-like flavoprotein